MTDFTSEFIAKQRKIINDELPIEAATQAEYYYSDALDEIERLQTRVQEVEDNREHIEMLLCKAEKRIAELEETISQDTKVNIAHFALLYSDIAELEKEKAGILSVLGEVVSEAYLQDPFEDDAGMALLHGASLLLEKMVVS
jgi:DNA repair exonuclease SbcCD ATPase subunit